MLTAYMSYLKMNQSTLPALYRLALGGKNVIPHI